MLIQFKVSIAGRDFAYSPGEIVDLEQKKAIRFCENGQAIPVKSQDIETQMVEYPKHTGGGWYELSNGDKKRGKKEAIKAEKALNEGG